MHIDDDRTKEQKATHNWLVIGTDSFMSGWGKADGGASYAAWACKPEDRDKVLSWVESRPEMKRIRETCDPYRPKGVGHCHIYLVHEDHVSIRPRCEHEGCHVPATGNYVGTPPMRSCGNHESDKPEMRS